MITLNVNGNAHKVDVPDDMPLLWTLRDVLNMTGTKFGCGMGLCGACTIQIDRQPTRSCITPVSSTPRGIFDIIKGHFNSCWPRREPAPSSMNWLQSIPAARKPPPIGEV